MTTIFNDHKRYLDTYWQNHEKKYFTGDRASVDENGNFWIKGRADDVINESGHRLSATEIEAALCAHPLVSEAAVIGKKCDIKGESICGFICVGASNSKYEGLESELKSNVCQSIGSFARPDNFYFFTNLPKTRSGKIMRRLLRSFAETGEFSGDLSTLESNVIQQ